MLGSIDKNLKPKIPKIYLCKPNKSRIGFIKNHMNARSILKFNDVHEFSLDIPYKLFKDGKVLHNDLVDKVKARYLLEVDGEYYIIDKYERRSQDGKDVLRINSKHLIYELRDKDVRGLEGVFSLREALDKTLLADSNWSIAYIDPVFNLTYRDFDVTGETLLQFLFNTIKKFKSVIYYDSKEREIWFFKQDSLTIDRGLQLNEKKYLDQIMDTTDMETVCTRLRAFGQDGASIQEYNPTGQNFIENYTYFMYPYEEDEQGNVISSSNWMSDELCHAIINYSDHVQSLSGAFKDILEDLMDSYSELSDLRTELFDLESELQEVEDNLYLANVNEDDTSDLILEKEALKLDISALEEDIGSIELDIEGYESEIDDLRENLDITNFYMDLFNNDEDLVKKIIDEKRNFEIYRTFENSSYFDLEELYEVAQEEIIKYILPPVNIDLSLVNFLNMTEAQNDWDRIGVGYNVYISYSNFGIRVKSKITELEVDYERNNINIRIADSERLSTDEDYINEMFYRNTSSSNKVEANKKWWEVAEEDSNFVRRLLEDGWDANMQQIKAGIKSEVTINKMGIKISSPDDDLNFLVARHGILAITNDGGNSYKNAITKDGVIAERIIGHMIAGEHLLITNDSGSVEIDGDGIKITNGTISWESVNSDDSKADVDYVNQQTNQLTTSFNNLNDNFIDAISDSTITEAEASQLETLLASFITEVSGIISTATSIGGLSTEINNLTTARDNLESEINKWTGRSDYPVSVSSSDRNRIKSTLSSAQEAKSQLIIAIDEKRDDNTRSYVNQQTSQLTTSFNDLNDNFIDAISGGTITEAESKQLEMLLDNFQSEVNDVIIIALNLGGLSSEVNDLIGAKDDLEDEINKWVGRTDYPTPVSSIDRNRIKSRLSYAQEAKSRLILAIDEKRDGNTRDYIDEQKQELKDSFDDLEVGVYDALSDGKITASEAAQLEMLLEGLKKESESIISIAQNIGLSGGAYYLQNRLNDLESEMNKWIGKHSSFYPADITSGERSNLKDKLASFQSAKSSLINSIAAKREERAIEESADLIDEIADGNYQGGTFISGKSIFSPTIVNNKAGMTDVGTLDSSIRIWAGDTFNNRGSAPFRVRQDGGFYAGSNGNSYTHSSFRGLHVPKQIGNAPTDGVYCNSGSDGHARWKYSNSSYLRQGDSVFSVQFSGAKFTVSRNGNVNIPEGDLQIPDGDLSVSGESSIGKTLTLTGGFREHIKFQRFSNHVWDLTQSTDFDSSLRFEYNGSNKVVISNARTRVYDDFVVDGDKNVIQPTENYGNRLMNALETPDSRFVAYQEHKLEEGEHWIEIEPMYLETISDYFIVPHIQNASEVVMLERREGKFRVWVHGHTAEVVFEINGKRKGFEDVYMKELIE